jgi:hypothetical protein
MTAFHAQARERAQRRADAASLSASPSLASNLLCFGLQSNMSDRQNQGFNPSATLHHYFLALSMSRSKFLINNTPEIQQVLLDFYLEKADKFRAYFPGGEELSGSRPDFLALEGVSVQPWSGMLGCIVVEGALTPAARALIQDRGKLDEDGYNHPQHLWQYELVNEAEVLLQIADFSVWIVFATLNELQSLEEQKIPISEWQEISLEPEAGVMPLPMTESDLEVFTQAIEEAFFPENN